MDWRTWRAKNHDIDIKEQVREGVYRVNGDQGIDYTTNVVNYSCTCPDWKEEKPEGGCKHIRAVNIAISNGKIEQPRKVIQRQSCGEQISIDWDERRRKVKERDGWICQKCGKPGRTTQLHVHYIESPDLDASHDLGNLTTLCKRCHQQNPATSYPSSDTPKSGDEGTDASETSVDADGIRVVAPLISSVEMAELRKSLPGENVFAGEILHTKFGEVQVVATSPPTSSPRSPNTVLVTETTEIKFD